MNNCIVITLFNISLVSHLYTVAWKIQIFINFRRRKKS